MLKQRATIRDHSAEANLVARRAFVAFVFVMIVIGILFVNVFNLQVNQHQSYQTRSNENRIKVIPIAPNRGLIYDRNGVLLAENRPVYNLEVIPEESDDLEKSLSEVSALFDISQEQQQEFLKNSKRKRRFKSQILKSRLTPEQVALFSVNQHKYPGFSVEARLARHYPYGDALTHAIGYVAKMNKTEHFELEMEGRDVNYRATRDIGKLGIEKYYEEILHGTVGSEEVEINNRGRILRTLKSTDPEPGKDLILTLDIGLQQIAQAALDGMRGAVVVMDARDGGILAFYSNPSYDPNLFVHGISSKDYKALLNPDRPLVNRVTKGVYPPASTIKPHLAMLALDEDVVTETTELYDPGFFKLPKADHRWRDWKPWGHGKVDVYRAIEESCDTYFYEVGYRLGIDKISEFMYQFGFGQRTGIDIHEEKTANLPSREWKEVTYKLPWYPGDTPNISIGQGYWTATPMQIANSMTIMVNKGLRYQPHLVSATKLSDQVQIIARDEKPPVQLKNDENWDIALRAMYNTVHKKTGTAHKAFIGAQYTAGGKTGTAQVKSIAQGERYNAEKLDERHRDNAMYIGFAPYEKPEIVIAVAVENTGGGATVGAPIARTLMDYYFSNKPESLVGKP
ncbi:MULTISPECIES: penicillin-binding protein 2 [Pseudoalteromonas]|uniref:penicillin-binding protein 2 n=1 Tax=Pseudoalteromonas TaxID=53246 RepID=UPI000C2D4204|nr:penicillin-binding protein 2 [Pseudoalteromonas spongiae]